MSTRIWRLTANKDRATFEEVEVDRWSAGYLAASGLLVSADGDRIFHANTKAEALHKARTMLAKDARGYRRLARETVAALHSIEVMADNVGRDA